MAKAPRRVKPHICPVTGIRQINYGGRSHCPWCGKKLPTRPYDPKERQVAGDAHP